MKNIFLFIAAIIIVSILLAGCGTPVTEPEGAANLLPTGATNVVGRGRDDQWATFDLSIDSNSHSFLIHANPNDSRSFAITEICDSKGQSQTYLRGTLLDKKVLIEPNTGRVYIETFSVNLDKRNEITTYTVDGGDQKIVLEKQ